MSKLVSKVISLIIIIAFIAGFKEMILTNQNLRDAFSELMGTLPFAQQISDIIVTKMGYSYEIPLKNSFTLLEDCLKLAIMAALQPLVTGFMSLLFLKLPKGNYYKQEEYMDSVGYRVKEMILTIFTAPFLAFFASWGAARLLAYFNDSFGPITAGLLGIATLIIIIVLSTVPLLLFDVAFGVAILWRVLITLLGKIVTMMGIDVLCLWLFMAYMNDMEEQAVMAVVSLIIWLVMMDVVLQCLQRVVVS